MKLTGKCKEDFEKWYLEEYLKVKDDDTNIVFMPKSWAFIFYKKKPSEQYGVYVDFFDSVGIYTSIEPLYDMQGTNRVCIYSLYLENNYYLQCKNRKEAREQAILKANEIYNDS